MALIKEDGSLDIERINKLSLEEWMQEIGNLTDKQFNEYNSKCPMNESKEPVRPVVVDYTLEEDIERNKIVNADDLINKLRNNERQ